MNHLDSPLFKALFDTNAPRIVLKANAPDFTILAYNEAYKVATNNNNREISGMSLWQAYPGEESLIGKKVLADGLMLALETKQATKLPVFEYKIPDNDPTETQESWWQLEIMPIPGNDGKTEFLLTTTHNITALVLRERNFDSSVQREEDLSRKLADTHEQLAASNEELQASIEELLTSNHALSKSRHDLESLNIQLEERILRRTNDLEFNRHLLQSIIQTTPVAMTLLVGGSLIIEHPNPPMLNIWQRTWGETVGKSIIDVFPELKGQQFPKLLANVFETGQKIAMPEVVVDISSKEGNIKQIYVNFSYDPIFDGKGKVVYILATVMDITESVESRKKLEESKVALQFTIEELAASNEELAATNEELATTNEELQESQDSLFLKNEELADAEENLGLALESGNLGTYSVDLVSRKFEISNRAREFYGLAETGDIFWGDVVATVVPSYLPIIEKARNKALIKGLPYDVQYPIIQKSNGELRWIRVVGKSTENSKTKAAKFIGVIIDITKEIDDRQKIEDSEKRFRTMAEGTDVLIAVGDETNMFTYFNDAWFKLTGRSMENLLQLGWVDLIHPDDKERYNSIQLNAFDQKIPFTSEFRILNKEGEYRWLLAKSPPRFNTNGLFVGYISTCVDITELKKDEQRKNDFIGMVSHELKTPLTAINGFVQVLQSRARKTQDEYYGNALGKTHNQIKKMTTMINGFLNVSRLESGKLSIQKIDFSLNDLLREMVEESDLIQYSHSIDLSIKEPIIINADRDKIGSVISNLLSNAVKYSNAGTVIDINCYTDEQNAIVSVKDQGIGISAEDSAKLFQRYYRVGSNHTISGFGIGLYLSAEIIERHDGRIWVESKENVGSTFYFSLPL
ncbi:PAS domain-containing sensor histidine kinase [Pedobacter frigidisoli]|nr:PAS domain S-box protein [Pedobacter frigidisoli]